VVLSPATKILQLVALDGSCQLIKIDTGPAERLTSMTVSATGRNVNYLYVVT
jgi:hypothetical protein